MQRVLAWLGGVFLALLFVASLIGTYQWGKGAAPAAPPSKIADAESAVAEALLDAAKAVKAEAVERLAKATKSAPAEKPKAEKKAAAKQKPTPQSEVVEGTPCRSIDDGHVGKWRRISGREGLWC